MMRLFPIALAALALLAPSARAQALEDLSAGLRCPDTYGSDIAADGSVVIAMACPGGDATAVAPPGAAALEITAGYGYLIGDGGHLVIGRPGVMVLRGPGGEEVVLDPLAGYAAAQLRDLAPDGRAVGHSYTDTGDSLAARGTLWGPLGAAEPVAGLAGDGFARDVVGLSGAGWMAGNSGPGHAWRRSPGGEYTKLASIYPRRDRAWARAMSSAGDVIGESEDRGLRRLQVLWPAGSATPQSLPAPRRGSIYYTAVNASRVVVGEGYTQAGERRAYAWSARSGLVDLNRYAPADFVLRRALAVNDAGQVTGFGTRAGHDHAFRLTLPGGF